VRSSVDFTLGASLEDLRLSGAGHIAGTGNSIDNRLIGNGGSNLLSGGYGNDRLEGNGGDDTLDGGRGADNLSGGAGADTFQLRKYDIAGDAILDFSGAEGDVITIAGFTAKAQLVRESGDTWAVVDGAYRESFQIAGITSLSPDHYAFVA
jgi:Ca2+-binding RTX toxin-like protein